MYQNTTNPDSVILQCACGDKEHNVYVTLARDDKEIIFEKKFLQYLPWHRRIIKAVQYVLKSDPDYMWDTTIINDKKQAQKLIQMCQTLLSTFKK
jgi:hypothetical protein